MRSLIFAAIALTFSPAASVAADLADFVTACTKSTNLGDAICRCTGENASKDLTSDGFDFLVATLAQDQATVDAVRPKLGIEETMKASLYMTKGPAKCAKAGAPKE